MYSVVFLLEIVDFCFRLSLQLGEFFFELGFLGDKLKFLGMDDLFDDFEKAWEEVCGKLGVFAGTF